MRGESEKKEWVKGENATRGDSKVGGANTLSHYFYFHRIYAQIP